MPVVALTVASPAAAVAPAIEVVEVALALTLLALTLLALTLLALTLLALTLLALTLLALTLLALIGAAVARGALVARRSLVTAGGAFVVVSRLGRGCLAFCDSRLGGADPRSGTGRRRPDRRTRCWVRSRTGRT